jgi:hypothetical protein
LAAEDAILQICLHAAVSHRLGALGLQPFLDMVIMRQNLTVDWDLVAERARAWRISVASWLVLDLLAQLFPEEGAGLPLSCLSPSWPRRVLLRKLVTVQDVVTRRDRSRGLGKFFFLLLIVDRARDAMLLFWRALFPETGWLKLRYALDSRSPWRVWLWRVWHPLRVVLRGEV